jgi:hypothetical protein
MNGAEVFKAGSTACVHSGICFGRGNSTLVPRLCPEATQRHLKRFRGLKGYMEQGMELYGIRDGSG